VGGNMTTAQATKARFRLPSGYHDSAGTQGTKVELSRVHMELPTGTLLTS
jgi:hypothetical protein